MLQIFISRLFILLCCIIFSTAHAAPKPELWARWQKHTPESDMVIDHTAWDAFLQSYRHVDEGIALINYAEVSDSDRQALKNYLALLAGTDIDDANRNEQLAFWINLYNALTIDVILENYPVKSIRDIKSSLFSAGPWELALFSIAGETLTLNDIEHRILRPIFQDPRLHYAVNCASIGCPNVAAVAYTSDNTEKLLEEGASAYINHPRGVTLQDNELQVSSIYAWFKIDFGNNDADVIAHLKQYADPVLKEKLDKIESINGDFYNWALNEK